MKKSILCKMGFHDRKELYSKSKKSWEYMPKLTDQIAFARKFGNPPPDIKISVQECQRCFDRKEKIIYPKT